MVIYGLFFENGKMYIGLTTQKLEKRLYYHKYDAKRRDTTAIHRAINKYKDFEVEVLYEGETLDELKEMEMFFIDYFGTYKKGYNVTKGGEGIVGFSHSDETKKKLSKANKNLAPANAKLKELHNDPEWKKKFKESHVRTEEWIEKSRIGLKEYYKNPENRNKVALRKGGKEFKVIEVETGKEVGTWISQGICAEDLGIDSKKISLCLLGKRNTHKGYRFEYEKK